MLSYDGRVPQLSRKECLDGRKHDLQPLEKTLSFINIFPEEAPSRESLLLLVFSHRSALTVGFGFDAAANPMCQVLGVDIGLCPYGTAQCVPSRRRGAASVADDTVLLERYDGADVSALWASLGGNNSVRIPVSF